MFSLILFIITLYANIVLSYVIVLSGDGDIIQGETAQFKAEVLQDDSKPVSDEFLFSWNDNFVPKHTAEFKSLSPAFWNVTYNSTFPDERYRVTVKVYKYSILIKTQVGSASKTFDFTTFLKGDIVISQGNETRRKYVSSADPVTHEIIIQKSHLDFLNKTKNYVRTFWFVDCIYYGQKSNFEFSFNYTKVESIHHVEALLVATYINSLTNKQVLPSHSSENILLNSTLTKINGPDSEVLNRNSTDADQSDKYLDKSLREWLKNFTQTQGSVAYKSDYCINSSVIPMSSNYIYGFFRTNFSVKSPVKISPINGTNWLMDGEVLNINVSCNGSSPYSFCVLLKAGLYNVTGSETCKSETKLINCSFGIQHLFKKPSEYTLIVIISNSVSHVVKPIAVNIYKVTKHAQLSVIIVPVSFSLIATILIIFGVAYYVQSKRKYTIEVADFDFGNQTSSMEYKSFTERLRESVSNSLLKSHSYRDREDSWPESTSNSRKYGSMEG